MTMKNYLAAGCFAIFAGALFSCSSNDDEINGNGGDPQETETRYMSVTISYRGSGTRAESFEDGTTGESKLTSASIFFFDAAGYPSDVCLNGVTGGNGRLTNQFDLPTANLENTSLNGTTTDNITASTPVKIIISTEAGEKIPTRVVAVCNYPNMSELATLTYADLKKKLLEVSLANSAAKNSTIISEGNFVMSNAVYAENTTEMFSTPVTAENICKTEAEAIASPVNIYVERVNAKVQAAISSSICVDGATYEYNSNQYPIYKIDDESDLFLAVLGWNVTAVAPCTSLGKDINEAWPSDLLSSSEPWNSLDYKRSYWAINPKTIVLPAEAPYNGPATQGTGNMALQHGTFVDAYKRGFTNSNNIAYIYENAATGTDGVHKTELTFGGSSNKDYEGYTQVIVPGILLKKDGANYVAADICKWLGTEYTKAELKTAWANQVATELFYYDSGSSSYKSIRPEDLDFITIDDLQNALSAGETLADYGIPTDTYRRYSAWACLSNDAKSIQWYDKSIGSASTDAEKEAAKMKMADVNKYLKELLPAQVYEGGLTYYYFDINHLGGKKGVVRNHVYKFTINKIVGHGTPVYDPSEVIIPEKTEDVASYIAATIDILAWRIINQSVSLGE